MHRHVIVGHTVDGGSPAPPKKLWFSDDSPVNPNKRYGFSASAFSECVTRKPCFLRRSSGPSTTASGVWLWPLRRVDVDGSRDSRSMLEPEPA